MNKILILLALTLMAGCSEEPERNDPKAADKSAITATFKGRSEPAAIDAIWTSNTMFKVAVADDGSNRDGYASYVCGILQGAGMDAGYGVEIVDIQSVVSGSIWRELGDARC